MADSRRDVCNIGGGLTALERAMSPASQAGVPISAFDNPRYRGTVTPDDRHEGALVAPHVASITTNGT